MVNSGGSHGGNSDTGETAKPQQKGVEEAIPELEVASQIGAVAVEGYVYARMLTDNILAADITTADKTELAALVTEACSAWDAVEEACSKMSEYTDKAQVNNGSKSAKVVYSGRPMAPDKLPFILTAYAATDEMVKWAEDINNMYSNMTDKNLKTRDRFKQLSEQLGTDARNAAKQLQVANEILAGEYTSDGDYFQAWENFAVATKTTCKVGLFVGGIIASGGTIGATGITLVGTETAVGTAAVAGGFIVGGADCVIDVANTGSYIFLGDQHVVTKSLQGMADGIAPVSTAFSIANLGGATAGEALSLVGENLASLYQDGKVGGLTVLDRKSYLPSDEEQLKPDFYIDVADKTEADAIAAVAEAGGPTLPAENSVSVENWIDYLDVTAVDILDMIDIICATTEELHEEVIGETAEGLPVKDGTYTAVPQLSNLTRYSDVYKITENITCTDITVTVSNNGTASISYTYGKSGSLVGVESGYNMVDDTYLESDMPVLIENIQFNERGDEYIASGEFVATMRSRTIIVTSEDAIYDNEGNEILPADTNTFDKTSNLEFTINYELTFTKDTFSGKLFQCKDEEFGAYNIITFNGEF